MIDSKQVKEILFSMGADLCGIASIDRFDDAPEGYHPLDVMPSCKSVISFGCRFPVGTLACNTPVYANPQFHHSENGLNCTGFLHGNGKISSSLCAHTHK